MNEDKYDLIDKEKVLAAALRNIETRVLEKLADKVADRIADDYLDEMIGTAKMKLLIERETK